MQYDFFLQLVISSPLIHALDDLSQATPGFKPGFPAWVADDLPTALSLEFLMNKTEVFIKDQLEQIKMTGKMLPNMG